MTQNNEDKSVEEESSVEETAGEEQKIAVRKGGGFGFEETNRESNLQKTADILGKIKGVDINVQCNSYKDQDTDVRENTDSKLKFNITIGAKDYKLQESSKTKFERAVSSILFDTSKNLYNEQKVDLINFAKDKHQTDVGKIADGVYSALEQRRLNSMMGYLYKGYEDRYTEVDLKKAQAEFANKEIEDPATAIQAAQLGLTEKVANSKFPRANQYVKDVERTGVNGSLILAKEYLDEVVKPWYIDNYANDLEQPQGEGQGQGEGGQGEGEGDPQESEDPTGGCGGMVNPAPTPAGQGEDGEPNPEQEGEGKEDGEGQGTGQTQQSGDGNGDEEEGEDGNPIEGNPAGGCQGGQGQGEGEGEGQGEPHSGNLNKHQKGCECESCKKYNFDGKKPTERQLEALKHMGYDGETPETRGDASDLISRLKDGEDSDDLNQEFPKQTEAPKPTEPRDEKDDDLTQKSNEAKKLERKVDPAKDMRGNAVKSGNQTLEESAEEAEEQLGRIEDQIADLSNVKDDDSRKFEFGDRDGYSNEELEEIRGDLKVIPNESRKLSRAPVKVDRQTVNKLKGLFKHIKAKSKYVSGEEGNDIDIDLFIKNRTEGGVDFLISDVPQTGFAVVIGVDESGSMGGARINIAKTLCATLYKAFEELPNVEIHVIGWTSGRVHIIRKYEDVETLGAYGGTPFREATMWIADYVNRLPQKKKLFFQITDGDVDYDDKMIRFIQNMNRRGIVSTGVEVSDYGDHGKEMEMIFGRGNAIRFADMADVKRVLVKQIAKQFMRFSK